jgi:hypothetical protein
MTIGDCADAGLTRTAPAIVKAAIDAAAKISFRMFPPAKFLQSQPGPEACMPAEPIQRSRPKHHCPLAGADLLICCIAKMRHFVSHRRLFDRQNSSNAVPQLR